MTTTFKILNLLVLGLLITICILGIFYKHISFGLGLGDIFGYLILFIGTLTHLVLTIVSWKKGLIRHLLLSAVFLTFTVLVALNATVWRGPQYRWNGSLFYIPCPASIKIENHHTKKEMLVQMCTMEYYSEFSGIWDGNKITLKDGAVLIPAELEKFITRPISQIEIEPDFMEKFENKKPVIKYQFKKDSLIANKVYRMEGEIVEIRNQIPVMRVTIR
jgi:hypothetical protein